MKRLVTLLTACALAAALASGCSKGSDQANAQPSGPITDMADTGLKPSPAPSMGALGDVAHGSTIFAGKCASCHGAAGAGGGIGPVLKGEKTHKDWAAAVAWIKNPQLPMPKYYPATLKEKDVDDVAAYVETL